MTVYGQGDVLTGINWTVSVQTSGAKVYCIANNRTWMVLFVRLWLKHHDKPIRVRIENNNNKKNSAEFLCMDSGLAKAIREYYKIPCRELDQQCTKARKTAINDAGDMIPPASIDKTRLSPCGEPDKQILPPRLSFVCHFHDPALQFFIASHLWGNESSAQGLR